MVEHQCTIAELADKVRAVRCEDQRPVSPFFEEFIMTLLVEVGVSDHDHFVDQVTVEFDGQRQGKREARPHA